MKWAPTLYQFILGLVFGAVIACSPTRFTPTTTVDSLCANAQCTTAGPNGGTSVEVSQSFEVGAGKVDILFVSDNSASMSSIQKHLASKFSGFIQNLDSKKIDYRIAVTTTDLAAVQTSKLVTFANGKFFLTNQDSNRINQFNAGIIRDETRGCEEFIIGMYNTYRSSFQSQPDYISKYPVKCSSPDTRGTQTALLALTDSESSFIRSDANLNVIVISNDDVRQGRIALEENDKAEVLVSTIQSKYPDKYWDFNSIIVKNDTCKQSQVLRNYQNEVIINETGNPAINGGIGYEYAKVSNSAAKDIDNNPRPRGKILDICAADYASHFTSVATQISDDARMFSLNCAPVSTPEVVDEKGAPLATNLYTWSDSKLVFKRGTEGKRVSIKYVCRRGAT